MAVNPYGYGTAPGGPYGYYEQQTPVGSFAAANQQQANAYQAQNPWIGMNSQQAGLNTANANLAGANPYIGQNTERVSYQGAQGAGANPYAGSNPYLDQTIQSTVGDATRGFQNAVMPSFDRMAQASGSFGNTGVEAARGEATNDFSRNLANTVGNMRFGDYTTQQGLAENSLNRNQALNQFNAGNQFQANMANAGFNSGDLSRNLGALSQLGMFNAGAMNNMGQFNAGQGNNMNQFNAGLGAADLNRNANLAQNMGQFNAGAMNTNSMFNAGQGNAMNTFNAGAGNNMLGQVRQNAFTGNENALNRTQRADEFNQGQDFNVWDRNQYWMNQGQRNNLDAMGQMLNWNQQYGVGNANNIQNTPLNYWQQFANAGNAAGGQGGSTNQQMPGNPYLGALGGWQLGSAFSDPWRP